MKIEGKTKVFHNATRNPQYSGIQTESNTTEIKLCISSSGSWTLRCHLLAPCYCIRWVQFGVIRVSLFAFAVCLPIATSCSAYIVYGLWIALCKAICSLYADGALPSLSLDCSGDGGCPYDMKTCRIYTEPFKSDIRMSDGIVALMNRRIVSWPPVPLCRCVLLPAKLRIGRCPTKELISVSWTSTEPAWRIPQASSPGYC